MKNINKDGLTPKPVLERYSKTPKRSRVRGTLDVLTNIEQADLSASEEVVGSGCSSVVEMGLALARIRDLCRAGVCPFGIGLARAVARPRPPRNRA
jgi:hypothetical protein